MYWGPWVAQLLKHLTLNFGSGHDLTICEIKPHVKLCASSVEPAWDSLSPSLHSLACTCSFSLKTNTLKKCIYGVPGWLSQLNV